MLLIPGASERILPELLPECFRKSCARSLFAACEGRVLPECAQRQRPRPPIKAKGALRASFQASDGPRLRCIAAQQGESGCAGSLLLKAPAFRTANKPLKL